MTDPDPRRLSHDVRRYGPVLIQLLGVVAMAVGFGLLAAWAGLVAGGAGLLAFGVAAEVNATGGD